MKIQLKDKKYEIEKNIDVDTFILENEIKSEYPIIAGIFNNEYINLGKKLQKEGNLELIDISSKEGVKIYRRTIIYILAMAFERIYPKKKLSVNYQLRDAMYCEIEDNEITQEMVEKIEKEMKQIIQNNFKIEQRYLNREEAIELYKKENTSKGRLQLNLSSNRKICMYYCDNYYNYCYGTIGNRTGITNVFELVKYENGFLVRYPNAEKPHELPKFIDVKKIAWALEEYDNIHQILDVEKVYKLNQKVEDNKIKEVIMIDEALHEKKIANIADEIRKKREVKMILIAGPSSSGKTTFAQRLGIQLRINGIKPVTISVDNYFVEREETPKDKFGNLNFESIQAIDLKLFNKNLTELLNGNEVEIPQFNFETGKKEYKGKKLKLEQDEVLVIEGIHCLNDELTKSINKKQKFKIYISALTVLNMDRYNRISTSDTRLIRRIVRDSKFRAYTAANTIKNWKMVRKGEVENIFPFEEEANVIFNTSLIYELGVLKSIAIPLLEKITKEEKEYAEAQRLIEILKYFKKISPKDIPTNSLLKEFIGGGDFEH